MGRVAKPRRMPAERQQKRTFTGTLCDSWSRHGQAAVGSWRLVVPGGHGGGGGPLSSGRQLTPQLTVGRRPLGEGGWGGMGGGVLGGASGGEGALRGHWGGRLLGCWGLSSNSKKNWAA